VKSTYNKVSNVIIDVEAGLYNQLWDINVLPTMVHFAWRVLINRVQIRQNLIKRMVGITNPKCVLCVDEVECAQHLFFGCSLPRGAVNELVLSQHTITCQKITSACSF